MTHRHPYTVTEHDTLTGHTFVTDDAVVDSLAYSHDPTDDIIDAIDARRAQERELAKKKPSVARITILDATPERLGHANDNHGKGADGVRRITDSPFERMYHRRQLDKDPETNETLYAAGLRYHSDWYAAGMSPVQAMDPGAVGGGGYGAQAPAYAKSERATAKLEEWRAARAAVPERLVGVLDAVVLEGFSLTDEAPSGGRVRRRAKERLVEALDELARHYGLYQVRAA